MVKLHGPNWDQTVRTVHSWLAPDSPVWLSPETRRRLWEGERKKEVSILHSSLHLPSPSPSSPLLPCPPPHSYLNTLSCPLLSPAPLSPFIILVNEVFLKKRSTKLMQLKVDNSQISQSFNSKISPIFTKQYFLNKEVR